MTKDPSDQARMGSLKSSQTGFFLDVRRLHPVRVDTRGAADGPAPREAVQPEVEPLQPPLPVQPSRDGGPLLRRRASSRPGAGPQHAAVGGPRRRRPTASHGVRADHFRHARQR